MSSSGHKRNGSKRAHHIRSTPESGHGRTRRASPLRARTRLTDQIGRQRRELIGSSLGPAVFDRDTLAFGVAGFFEALAKSPQPYPVGRMTVIDLEAVAALLSVALGFPSADRIEAAL